MCSPLERWYGMRGFVEPLGDNQYLFWNKLLIRKPVAIYCAMRRALEQRAPASSATQHVLWADTDVEFEFYASKSLCTQNFVPNGPL